jgi:hypothetical protein
VGARWRPLSKGATKPRERKRADTTFLTPIRRSAWKGNSRNFAMTGFSEAGRIRHSRRDCSYLGMPYLGMLGGKCCPFCVHYMVDRSLREGSTGSDDKTPRGAGTEPKGSLHPTECEDCASAGTRSPSLVRTTVARRETVRKGSEEPSV